MPHLKINSKQQAIKVGEHKGENMFVMKVDHYGVFDADKIIKYVNETQCIPKAQLRAAWEALGDAICTWTLEGHIVEIPGLGNIRAEVRASARKHASDVSTNDIIRRKLLLTPTKEIKNALNSAALSITCYDTEGRVVRRTDGDEE